MTSDNKTESVKTTSLSQHEFDFKHVKNRASDGCAHDFNSLLYPNEPEILCFLSNKYSEKQFYHRIGDVTISLNPCETITQDYESFINKSALYNIDHTGQHNTIAHAYETADAAFNSMCADKYHLDKRVDQSIFVRGCCGSGKTENVKLILQYLTCLSMRVLGSALQGSMLDSPRLVSLKEKGASSKSITFDTSLEGRFTAVNTVLESMGNACRQCNSNSSRIGRVVTLGYAADCYIEDMSVDTFLLDTERVHSQQGQERNFHIFYELAAGASAEFRAECGIENLADFRYTNQGGVFHRHDKVSDAKMFKTLCRALDTLMMSAHDQEDFLKCIAGVLHMGNVSFDQQQVGKSVVFSDTAANKHHLDCVCRLLSISKLSFQKALCKHVVVGDQSSQMPSDVATAEAARNHLAKTVYQLLLQRVLEQYKSLRHSSANHLSCTSKITVVDCFGTESTKTNSFMQFCINYSSEKVHNHFMNTVFEKDQRRYISQGIEWNFISYVGNTDIVQLFESPETGLFKILETEAHMPNPTDEKLMLQCQSKIKSSGFKCSVKEPRGMQFTVAHHTGSVTYTCQGFTDKNKVTQGTSEVHVLSLFRDSASAFVQSLAADMSRELEHDHRLRFVSSASRVKTSTLLLQRQLDALIKQASRTKQHWLICVKPSSSYTAGQFDDALVLDQIIDTGLAPLVALTQRGTIH
jgi:myosin heavy subunit